MTAAILRWFSALMDAKAASRPMWLEEPRLKVVCCWCTPHHVIRDGVEPTSHGACPIGIAKFESGAAA